MCLLIKTETAGFCLENREEVAGLPNKIGRRTKQKAKIKAPSEKAQVLQIEKPAVYCGFYILVLKNG